MSTLKRHRLPACPPWCVRHVDHRDTFSVGDRSRTHFGPSRDIPVSSPDRDIVLEVSVALSSLDVRSTGFGQVRLDPAVTVTVGDTESTLDVVSARRLAASLLGLVELAEGGAVAHRSAS